MHSGDTVNETRRLATLHSLGVLDTNPNSSIDGIAKAAAGVCSAPIALVTLLDEKRQWFKARFGLDDLTETHRSVAFCDHAIRGDEVMVVENALEDERFKDNPLVTGRLGIRFYAGVPLVAKNGARLGALCVFDQKPGTLAKIQIEALSRLAETVVELLCEEGSLLEEEIPTDMPSDFMDTPERITGHARDVLISHGPESFSVRKVAKAAGVSLSNIQHHYPSKAALIGAIIDNLRDTFYAYYANELERIPNPVDRFVACAKHILHQGPDDEMIKLLRDLWSMAAHDRRVALNLTTFYLDCKGLASSILQEANPELDETTANLRACHAVSLLSGAFLYTAPWVQDSRVAGFEQHVIGVIARLPFQED